MFLDYGRAGRTLTIEVLAISAIQYKNPNNGVLTLACHFGLSSETRGGGSFSVNWCREEDSNLHTLRY